MITQIAYAAPTIAKGTDICKNISFKSIADIFNWASCTIVSAIIHLLFTLATAGFIWGVIRYFLNPNSEEERKKGKSYMLWGLIALFVMVSVWGLVNVFSNTFKVKTLIPQLSNTQ